MAIGMETMSKVESLANPASTLIDFVSIGTVDNQSAKSPAHRSFGLMSSPIRMLKRSLGYSELPTGELPGRGKVEVCFSELVACVDPKLSNKDRFCEIGPKTPCRFGDSVMLRGKR